MEFARWTYLISGPNSGRGVKFHTHASALSFLETPDHFLWSNSSGNDELSEMF